MKGRNNNLILGGLIVLEVFVIAILFLTVILPNTGNAGAVVGRNNVTVQTLLQVGNVFPEVLNVTISDGAATIDLVPNGTRNVTVYVIARDFNGENDLFNITAIFFDPVNSTYGAVDDKNRHYNNSNCTIDYDYGDIYEVSANCTFYVEYYANNATWNATVLATDNASWVDRHSGTIVINRLLALALPDNIDYGIVNATEVSAEIEANVSNAGNTIFNLSLYGYATNYSDNLSMNCTLGAIKNISIEHEKYLYNSSATPGVLTFNDLAVNYTNLTATNVFRTFDLKQRQDDAANEAFNSTFWRIYVPLGVAGSCRGNIVFGAVQTEGT